MPRILILRFSSIGDIVLTTPVIRCLKKQIPGAEVHFFTLPAFQGLLENNPYIDRIHVLDSPLLYKTLELKKAGFDYVIDLHNNLRTMLVKAILAVPSTSFNKLNIEKWIRVNLGMDILPRVHIVDRYLETASHLGVTNDQQGLDYFIPASTRLPVEIRQPYIAISIGAQHGTKKLPESRIRELCNLLHLPVVLLGGKDETETAQRISQNCSNQVINLCGSLTLDQSALVLQQAYKVITHDTGLMHIAAALKKEILSVWGNTIPEFGMSPYLPLPGNRQFEVTGLECRPCSKIGFDTCPKGHFKCMENQHLEEIRDAAQSWIFST